jgi:hypothetical protein
MQTTATTTITTVSKKTYIHSSSSWEIYFSLTDFIFFVSSCIMFLLFCAHTNVCNAVSLSLSDYCLSKLGRAFHFILFFYTSLARSCHLKTTFIFNSDVFMLCIFHSISLSLSQYFHETKKINLHKQCEKQNNSSFHKFVITWLT